MTKSVDSFGVVTVSIDASQSNRSKALSDIMQDFTIQDKKGMMFDEAILKS